MKVTHLCLTLCNPMDYTVHGILQTRILEWVAFPFSRGSSQTRDRTRVPCIAGRFFTNYQGSPMYDVLICWDIFYGPECGLPWWMFHVSLRRMKHILINWLIFIFGCAGSLWLCELFSSCGSRAALHCSAQASRCSGFSRGAQALGARASVAEAAGL